MRYDADKAPDPDQWLELDEHDRIDLVGRLSPAREPAGR
jgi:hypothetical protein